MPPQFHLLNVVVGITNLHRLTHSAMCGVKGNMDYLGTWPKGGQLLVILTMLVLVSLSQIIWWPLPLERCRFFSHSHYFEEAQDGCPPDVQPIAVGKRC